MMDAATAAISATNALPVIPPTAIATKAATSIMPSAATFRMFARSVIIVASAANRIGVDCIRTAERKGAMSMIVLA